MPFREKTAWMMIAALAVSYGAFFTAVASIGGIDELPNLRLLAWFAAAMGVQVLIIAIGRMVIRAQSPEDARAPADERDRAIDHRSTAIAYHVMMAGLVLVGVAMPFTSAGWEIVLGSLATFVAAEFVRLGMTVIGYRRAWHG